MGAHGVDRPRRLPLIKGQQQQHDAQEAEPGGQLPHVSRVLAWGGVMTPA